MSVSLFVVTEKRAPPCALLPCGSAEVHVPHDQIQIRTCECCVPDSAVNDGIAFVVGVSLFAGRTLLDRVIPASRAGPRVLGQP